MDDAAKKAEIDAYFKQQMEESKKVWEMRGRDARIKAEQARLNGPKTWRQMKGVELMMHEVQHVGNRPFVIGLATIAVGCFYLQSTFTDEMKKNSPYWQAFHAKDDKKH